MHMQPFRNESKLDIIGIRRILFSHSRERISAFPWNLLQRQDSFLPIHPVLRGQSRNVF